jgi:RNA polymerase sigma-70 factor (ECF subfamily)
VTDTDKDELLLEKARGGNQEAFLVLYQRHRNPIFRFLYRLLGSAELAEDIAHDCFLSLIRDSEKSSSSAPASLRTRLYSTARTRAMEYLENSNVMEFEATQDESDNQAHGGKLVSEVAEGIASLPALEREALILSEYEGLELDEIAAIVGADVRTVAERRESARQRLRNVLANHLSGNQ